MELNQLRYFAAVARAESITKASQELFITQSALSRVILRLENELGTSLFDRQGGRILLNESGKAFLGHISAALTEIEAAAKEVSADMNHHSISIYNFLATNLFEYIVDRCQALFPSLECRVHNYEISEDDDPIRKYAPELVMTPQGELKSYSVISKNKEKWCVILNEKYQLKSSAEPGALSISQLADEQIAFFGSPFDKAFIYDMFAAHGLKPNLRLVSNTAESAVLINRCKCVGFVSINNFRYLYRNNSNIPIKALLLRDEPCERDVYLMKKYRFPSQDEERAAMDFILNSVMDETQKNNDFIAEYFA